MQEAGGRRSRGRWVTAKGGCPTQGTRTLPDGRRRKAASEQVRRMPPQSGQPGMWWQNQKLAEEDIHVRAQ